MATQSPLEVYARHAWNDKSGFLENFAGSLKLKNQGRGIARVIACLRKGENTHGVLDRLLTELNLDKDLWEALLEITRHQDQLKRELEELKAQQNLCEQLERERCDFKPYVYVLSTEESPTISLAIYALAQLGKERLLPVDPSWIRESYAIQREWVRELIQNHYAESEGICKGMGRIRGYEYRCRWRETWVFDVKGELLEENYEPQRVSEVALRL